MTHFPDFPHFPRPLSSSLNFPGFLGGWPPGNKPVHTTIVAVLQFCKYHCVISNDGSLTVTVLLPVSMSVMSHHQAAKHYKDFYHNSVLYITGVELLQLSVINSQSRQQQPSIHRITFCVSANTAATAS